MSKKPKPEPIDYGKAYAFQDYIQTRRVIQYNVDRRHHAHLPRLQSRIGEHEKKYPDFAETYRKIKAEHVRAEKATRYWMHGRELNCRHGVILYGTSCVTCEKDDK